MQSNFLLNNNKSPFKIKGAKKNPVYYSAYFPSGKLVNAFLSTAGRPYFSFEGEFTQDRAGEMDTEMVREFFYAISYSAGMNLHIRILSGTNNHHKIEAAFKAFGRALDEATGFDPRVKDVLSTKGSL